MAYKNSIISYGSVAKFLHWLIFLMVTLLLVVGFLMSSIPFMSLKGMVYNLHKWFGLIVLGLMLFRLYWMLTNKKPKLPDKTKPWERLLSHLMHYALYFFVIAMPLSGWVMASAAGKPPVLWSGFQLPLPGVPLNMSLAHNFAELHELLALIIISLLTLHIAAAFKHHFIDRDFILKRMLPKKWLG